MPDQRPLSEPQPEDSTADVMRFWIKELNAVKEYPRLAQLQIELCQWLAVLEAYQARIAELESVAEARIVTWVAEVEALEARNTALENDNAYLRDLAQRVNSEEEAEEALGALATLDERRVVRVGLDMARAYQAQRERATRLEDALREVRDTMQDPDGPLRRLHQKITALVDG